MTHFIDKSAVVAQIERYKNSFCDRNGYLEDCETNGLAYDTLCELEDSIEALEVKVKEVGLDYIKKELDRLIRIHKPYGDFGFGTLYNVATHFFELGVAVSNKAQKGE